MNNEANAKLEEEAIIAMLMMRARALGEKNAEDALSYEAEGFGRVFTGAAARQQRQGRGEPSGLVRHLGRPHRRRSARCQTDSWRGRRLLERPHAHDGNQDRWRRGRSLVPPDPRSRKARRSMAGGPSACLRTLFHGWQHPRAGRSPAMNSLGCQAAFSAVFPLPSRTAMIPTPIKSRIAVAKISVVSA